MSQQEIRIRHLALLVPDLPAAEAYYQALFDLTLIGRECPLPDGLWYTLPFDKAWPDAQAAGYAPGMAALRRGDMVLALFQGNAVPGQVFAIGLGLSVEEIAALRQRLPPDVLLLEDEPDRLVFRDRYQIMWQIARPGTAFRTAGDLANRWLPI